MRLRRAIAAAVRLALGVCLMFLAIGTGKMMQLGAVELLGAHIGFNAASVVGAGIFILLLFGLTRFGRRFAVNRKGRRVEPAASEPV
jgi:hypothetical protein